MTTAHQSFLILTLVQTWKMKVIRVPSDNIEIQGLLSGEDPHLIDLATFLVTTQTIQIRRKIQIRLYDIPQGLPVYAVSPGISHQLPSNAALLYKTAYQPRTD